MTATQEESQTPENTAPTTESGEFGVERTFAEQGASGLEKMADNDVAKFTQDIESVADVGEVEGVGADAEVGQLKEESEAAKAALDAAKKELDVELGGASVTSPEKEAEQAEVSVKAPEAGAATAETAKVEEPEEAEAMDQAEEEADKNQEEEVAMESQEQEGEPSDEEEDAEMETPEAEQPIGFEQLIATEQKNLDEAKNDYEEAVQARDAFLRERGKPKTPIEQKYVSALDAQIRMDELSWQRAQNQIDLYKLKDDLEKTKLSGGDTGSFVEAISAKEAQALLLLKGFQDASKDHDAKLEDYEVSYDALQKKESESDEKEGHDEQEENVSNVDTVVTTGGSFGGYIDTKKEEAPTKPPLASKAKHVARKVGKAGGAVYHKGKAMAAAAERAVTPNQEFGKTEGGKEHESLMDKIATWASKLGNG